MTGTDPAFTDDELTAAFLAYIDSAIAVQRAEEEYSVAEKETVRPLIEARTAAKAARNTLAEQMQARGLDRVKL